MPESVWRGAGHALAWNAGMLPCAFLALVLAASSVHGHDRSSGAGGHGQPWGNNSQPWTQPVTRTMAAGVAPSPHPPPPPSTPPADPPPPPPLVQSYWSQLSRGRSRDFKPMAISMSVVAGGALVLLLAYGLRSQLYRCSPRLYRIATVLAPPPMHTLGELRAQQALLDAAAAARNKKPPPPDVPLYVLTLHCQQAGWAESAACCTLERTQQQQGQQEGQEVAAAGDGPVAVGSGSSISTSPTPPPVPPLPPTTLPMVASSSAAAAAAPQEQQQHSGLHASSSSMPGGTAVATAMLPGGVELVVHREGSSGSSSGQGGGSSGGVCAAASGSGVQQAGPEGGVPSEEPVPPATSPTAPTPSDPATTAATTDAAATASSPFLRLSQAPETAQQQEQLASLLPGVDALILDPDLASVRLGVRVAADPDLDRGGCDCDQGGQGGDGI
eukprot:CAMPEP_0202859978 /NCGR_PEP_ID=MMETSP1391-20130828/1877_1 /ASSEMBLY_ACC=CAM_ASM_000867 /TAXON_ID=1034604 /ORGANISM="Chlamydomonas leiostraca, Strain SAG 11-49" /LENGTH=442 /DNA_ID=CAMNT_0049539097 /DNA_START=299 /DNA_END=1627 /DNA_ORIENTATION=-